MVQAAGIVAEEYEGTADSMLLSLLRLRKFERGVTLSLALRMIVSIGHLVFTCDLEYSNLKVLRGEFKLGGFFARLLGLTTFNGGNGLLNITPRRSYPADFDSRSGSFRCKDPWLPPIVGSEVDFGRTFEDEVVSTFTFCRVIKLIAGSAVLFIIGLKDDPAGFFDSSTSPPVV